MLTNYNRYTPCRGTGTPSGLRTNTQAPQCLNNYTFTDTVSATTEQTFTQHTHATLHTRDSQEASGVLLLLLSKVVVGAAVVVVVGGASPNRNWLSRVKPRSGCVYGTMWPLLRTVANVRPS